METKSNDEASDGSSQVDSQEFNSPNIIRKQSYAGLKRNKIYRETSFAQPNDVRVPRPKQRRGTDKARRINESQENIKDVQLLMKSLNEVQESRQVYSDSDDEMCTIKD